MHSAFMFIVISAIVRELSFLICFFSLEIITSLTSFFISFSFFIFLVPLSDLNWAFCLYIVDDDNFMFFSSSFSDTLEVKLDKIIFLTSFCVTIAFGGTHCYLNLTHIQSLHLRILWEIGLFTLIRVNINDLIIFWIIVLEKYHTF